MIRTSCDCKDCKSACTFKPGGLKYGDEKLIAQNLGITVKELFDKYLLVDWYWQPEGYIFLLSPAVTRLTPGGMFDFNPKGTCTFFKDGLCSVHSVAPSECQMYIHTQTKKQVYRNHYACVQSWNKPEAQALIKELLGHDPQAAEPDIFSMLDLL